MFLIKMMKNNIIVSVWLYKGFRWTQGSKVKALFDRLKE